MRRHFVVPFLCIALITLTSFAQQIAPAKAKDVTRKASPAAAKKTGAKRAAVHPKVDPAQQCNTCHEAEYKQWDESRHATGGVLCVVCHGSVSENFMKQPAMARCQGCHAEKVETLKVSASARKTGNACFSCHAPHTLKQKKEGTQNPHATVAMGDNQ